MKNRYMDRGMTDDAVRYFPVEIVIFLVFMRFFIDFYEKMMYFFSVRFLLVI